jgi:hypothetical protein
LEAAGEVGDGVGERWISVDFEQKGQSTRATGEGKKRKIGIVDLC